MDKYLTRCSSTESLPNKRPAEEDLWRKPKRSANPKRVPPQVTFSTQNRFKDLQSDVDCSHGEKHSTVGPFKKNKSYRVPPIVIELNDNWSHQTTTSFVSGLTKNFHLQYRNKGKVAIHCHTNESHQVVLDGLRKDNIYFHTFTRKDERKYKAVVRGIPIEAIESAREELAELGFDATVTKLKGLALDDTNSCAPVLVQLSAGTDISKFKQIKYLCNCVINIERFKPNNSSGTQCYRCQRFGHASKNCNLPERCVKCVEAHSTKNCSKKDRTGPAHCCNCKDAHPANYRQCPARVSYLERLRLKRPPPLKQEHPIKEANRAKPTCEIYTTPPPQPNQRTWANVASSKYLPSISNAYVGARVDSATTQILEILNVIKSIKTEFISCSTMMDKVILVLTHLGQYV